METVETSNLSLTLVLIYAVISIGLTFFLARTLSRHGAVFLNDVFDDNPELAKALNHLLVTGFYMLNLGYAGASVPTYWSGSVNEGVTRLIEKVGVLLLTLGVIHFGNLYLFYRIRRRAKPNVLPLPVMPQVKIETTKMAG